MSEIGREATLAEAQALVAHTPFSADASDVLGMMADIWPVRIVDVIFHGPIAGDFVGGTLVEYDHARRAAHSSPRRLVGCLRRRASSSTPQTVTCPGNTYAASGATPVLRGALDRPNWQFQRGFAAAGRAVHLRGPRVPAKLFPVQEILSTSPRPCVV